MKTRHATTLLAVFRKPTSAAIVFADLEALIVALGGAVLEQAGSRLVFELAGACMHLHRPHPRKEANRYQVEEVRALLESKGFKP